MAKRQRFRHNGFKLEDKILTQNLKTKKWDIPGTIIQLIESDDRENRSFTIRTNKNEILWRSSRYICLDLTQPDLTQQNDIQTIQHVKTIQNCK